METNGKAPPTIAIELHSSSALVYEPRNFDEAMRLAVTYAKSNLLGEVRSPEAALLVMATGAELGIPATAALRGIYIVKGRPFLSADLMVAICLKRADLCEYFTCINSTAESATYETKRKGAPAVKSSFTIEEARKAGLIRGDSAWQNYAIDMLRHRAAARLARMTYPDLTLGLYCIEEQEEDVGRSPPGPQVLDAHFEEQRPVDQDASKQSRTVEPKRESPVDRPSTAVNYQGAAPVEQMFPASPPPAQTSMPASPPVSFGDVPPANDPPARATNEEPIESCVERWTAALAAAHTTAEADRVRREVKKRVTEGDPLYSKMVDAYKSTVQRLRHPGSTKPEDVIT